MSSYYIGIDLGTTNSAIATFDGENVRVWKAKDQQDVTPSCIYVDKNGKRFYGAKAYKALGHYEDRVARQFKRFMGTDTKIEYAGEEMTPEECSAEILRELVRCLPEEIANAEDKTTVIAVPANFSETQVEATKQAAAMAHLGKVDVVQEPVAAIVSVMQSKEDKNGNFFVFDMGSGALDMAVARAVDGRLIASISSITVSKDDDTCTKIVDNYIDTTIVDDYVLAWLENSEYNLPKPLQGNKKYEKLLSRARLAAEKAKIELSSCEETTIYGSLGSDVCDEDGKEIELDIPFTRADLNKIMEDVVNEAIKNARDTIKKWDISAHDFSPIIFIGGATNYKPLRDKVTRELGIRGENLTVNPMTAVAEGAAIHAKTIADIMAQYEGKEAHGVITSAEDVGLELHFEALTMKFHARLEVKLRDSLEGYQLQVKRVDGGYDSGLIDLVDGKVLLLRLISMGDNAFEINVYDNQGQKVELEKDTIVITKTQIAVVPVFASHTLSMEVCDGNLTDSVSLDPLVHKGDKLPVKGMKVYKATEKIKAGSPDALVFKFWRGESTTLQDNRIVTCIRIEGSDLVDFGSVRVGDEIIFEYTINEAEIIETKLSIERLEFSQNIAYDLCFAEEEQEDMSAEDEVQNIISEGEELEIRLEKIDVEDERLEEVRKIASEAQALGDSGTIDPELVQKHAANLCKAKQLLEEVRAENLTEVRTSELSWMREYYEDEAEQYASAEEKEELEEMFTSCEELIATEDENFESVLGEILSQINQIRLSNSHEYLVTFFKYFLDNPHKFHNKDYYNAMVAFGRRAINDSDYETLRKVTICLLMFLKKDEAEAKGMSVPANIMRVEGNEG